MAWFVSEANNLVLNGRAVSGTHRIHPTAIHGRLVQVVADELVGGRGGAGQVTVQLWPLHPLLQQRPMLVSSPDPGL